MMESKAYHVVPLGDLREHEVSLRCWCKPVQDEEEPNVWVHNSMDQRERYTDAGKLH